MDSTDPVESLNLRAKQVFLLAIETHATDDISRLIVEQCGDDRLLANEVRRLLDAHQRPNGILNFDDRTPIEQPYSTRAVIPRITNYEVGELIGEGGMGLVYQAIQRKPVTRTVAIKVLKPGLDSYEVLARFRIEQEALARMNHVGIAKVSDAGQTLDGYPFFAMELVEGIPITDHCKRARMHPIARLRLFLDVCAAVSHAHQKGIIHRDLKPTNILVSQQGDSCLPKVIDFGLARAIEIHPSVDARITKMHRVVGTPRYMSPEQARTNGEEVDTRSDIYSLGTILYEMFTNLNPRSGDQVSNAGHLFPVVKPSAAIHALSDDQAVQLAAEQCCSKGELESMLRRDLDWIILKALEEEPRRRYESVDAFAQDIRRFLNDQPIEARPPTVFYRASKLAKRHRTGMLVATTAVVSLLLFTFLMWRQSIESRRMAENTNVLLEEVRKQKERAEVSMYAADIRIAGESLAEGDIVQALALLQRQQPRPDAIVQRGSDYRGIEWSYLNRLATASRTQHPISSQSLHSIALSRDKSFIATSGEDATIWLLDVDALTQVNAIRTDHRSITSLAFSSDGTMLASGGSEGMINLWRIDTGESIGEIRFGPEEILDLQFSDDDQHLFSSGRTPDIRIFDVPTRKLTNTLRFHSKTNESIDLSNDGNLLGCASDDKRMSLWDWRVGKVVHQTNPGNYRLTRVAFSPNGEFIVFASVHGEVEVRSLKSWQVLHATKVPSAVQSLAVCPDSAVIAIGCRSGIIHLLDLDTEVPFNHPSNSASSVPKAINAHSGRVNDLVWINSHSLLSVGGDGSVVASRLDVELTDVPLDVFETDVFCVSHDGHWIGSHNYQVVRLTDTHTGRTAEIPDLKTETNFAGIVFSNDASQLLVATADGKLFVVAVGEPDQVREQKLPVKADFASLRFSPDGNRLMMFSRTDDTVVVVNLPNFDIAFQTSCPDAYTGTLSNHGEFLATSYQGDLLIYSVDKGEVVTQSVGHHSETINDLKFGPDGDWIVTSSDDRTIRIWYPWSNRPSEIIGVFPNGVPRGLEFSSDGRTLFTNSRSGEVWVFSIATRQKLFPILRSASGFREGLLSGDDSTFVTLDGNGQIRWLRLNP